ncbi:murein hydrolase activator EnvC family protein [Sulfuricystis thermophila]|uniref:murein hydrolase activator EnvC family protein n=1 Tax=Sulfuricystis thermophila TaxID=2496847 RepID=UPI001035858E|nr:peptidoglycan DD-metalloendopeptidase family protein [Sulfuricystis thermophila]
MIRTFIAAVFAVSSLLPPLAWGAGEREKAKLDAVREQRAALERQLREKEAARASAADQLREIERAIAASARKLRALGEERAAARSELAKHERELKRLSAQTAARQAQLAMLLRHQFRPQETDALAMWLAGDDPNEAARDRYFLAQLARAKAELIDQLREDAAETRRLAELVRQRNVQLTELARREEVERATLSKQQHERQALLAKLSSQIQAQRRTIETLKQDERRLADLLASLAKKKTPARPSKVPAGKTPSASPAAPTLSTEPANASGAFTRLRGRLPWPVKGSVAARFGTPREEGRLLWKGLFIRAPEGADVRAVADGVVVFADWLRGYGNLLIIDHDDGFLSIYGNNQTLLAEVGQKVSAGKPVATVGASGGLPESGLYFELRHRGQAFDPGKWLAGP